MAMPFFCAPVQSGMAPPCVHPAIMGNGEIDPMRIYSPVSDEEQQYQPVEVYNNDRKRTNILRFPCKARGLPDSHNARTAYIDVPANASHGTIVLCSHALCSSSGRQFRYCSVCMIPVAKRNFAKRHSHGLLHAPKVPYVSVGEEEVEEEGSSRSKRQRLNTYGSFGDTLRLLKEDLAENEESLEVPKTIIIEPATSLSEMTINACAASIESELLTPQECQWLSLFRNRPTNTTSEADIRTWMGAVLETAELKTSSLSSSEEEDVVEASGEDNAEEENNADASILNFLMDDTFLAD